MLLKKWSGYPTYRTPNDACGKDDIFHPGQFVPGRRSRAREKREGSKVRGQLFKVAGRIIGGGAHQRMADHYSELRVTPKCMK